MDEISGWSLEGESEKEEEKSEETGEKRSHVSEERDRRVALDSFLNQNNWELTSELARVVGEVEKDEVPAAVFVLESLDN